MKNVLGIILLLLLPTGIALCNSFTDYSSLRFSRITQREGLSHNNVECIFKDSEGFMWFGTRSGLCRFDGYSIEVFRSSNDTNSISGDRILSIAQDTSGNLWIGTYADGISRYDLRTGRFKRFPFEGEYGDRINRIRVLSDGSVWAATSHGLAEYLPSTDKFRVYLNQPGNPNSLNSNYVSDVMETRSGEVYIATEAQEIQRFDRKSNKFHSIRYKRSPHLTSNYRKRIVEDNQGKLWIAANVHGLSYYNPATGASGHFTKGPNSLSSNVLAGDMAIDPNGMLWVCTDGAGINIIDTQTGQFYYITHSIQDKNSLSSNHVYTIFFDDLKIAWVGTFGSGINIFNPAQHKFSGYFYFPGDTHSFRYKSVLSLFQDGRGRVWIGTDGNGLYMYDTKGNLKHFVHQPHNINSLPTNVIPSLGEDKYGNILIGTYSRGLSTLDVERWVFTHFSTESGSSSKPSSISVWRILRDRQNRVWLGLLGEGVDLYHSDNKTFTNYGTVSERSSWIDFPNIMAILEDREGNIWFGSEGRGVYALDSEKDKILRPSQGKTDCVLERSIVLSLLEDSNGYLWIGTEGRGMFRYCKDTKELFQVDMGRGLPSNIVTSMLEDHMGHIWLGTPNGLSVYNPTTGAVRTYIEDDGLSGNEFNPNASLRIADGRFMLGTTSGLDIFSPKHITPNPKVPKVVIRRLEILNQPVLPGEEVNGRVVLTKSINYTESITLTPKEKIFSLEFAALNYTLPYKCTYAYRLIGFDDTWYYTSASRRIVSYSNLPPGNYTFVVKASNNDGVWGDNERELKIRVLPPYYATWWFRVIVAFAFVSLVFFIYQHRLNIQKSKFMEVKVMNEKRILELEMENLDAELQKLTFHTVNRNRMLIDQKNRLLGIAARAKESDREHIQDIIRRITDDLSGDREWAHLEPQLDKVYSSFITKLKEKHPELTLSEIKIAAYIRMNLSNKVISELMDKTLRAIENDRYRLRRKIGLDHNVSLQSYLSSL